MRPMLRRATDNAGPLVEGLAGLLVDEGDAGVGHGPAFPDPHRELAAGHGLASPPAVHHRAAGGRKGEVVAAWVHVSRIPHARPGSRTIAPFASSSPSW